ncbi:hypothetical protein [Mesorhizobium sp. M1027]
MSTHDLIVPAAAAAARPWRERLGTMVPILVLAPSIAASFIYVFVFTF